ncbi:basic leucine zipper 24-like [Neltuma alba]|nr:basic leucine zipper 24-like [Prosopis alba]XP_028776347.1 basic leucine zipper 24-like [Prosopis alba]XP_028776348.1 basic leucine zipper 24-like [Prosopis alba]XP_028776353.1 basic leucine zipper 24-like [Prosopis alba]XP_028776354.1 basic leucine zipper 24-like [Prosopis alba]XP_028776356.1 basic leucine zipper 24-like [Prosopis alba]
MNDGDVELSDGFLLSNPESSSNVQSSTSMNKINEFLRNTRTCTHTHTCNPPGPDAAHTHTCYHTHTQVIASEEDDHTDDKEHTNTKRKRPSGNREAVRKYREKKKAQTAYLEEEVKKLRLQNQQLVRKLQGHAHLEAEVLRLRSILVDLKGKIDNELGVFPYKKQCNGSSSIFKEGHTNMLPTDRGTDLQCQTNFQCFDQQAGLSSQVGTCGNENFMIPCEGNCEPLAVNCQGNTNNISNTEGQVVDSVDNLMSSASQDK